MEAWARGWGRGAQSGFAGTGRQSGKAGAPGCGRLTRPSCALETATAVHEAVCVFCHDKKRCVMIPFASDRGRGRKGVVTTRSLAVGSPFAPSHISKRAWALRGSRRSPSRPEEKEAVCGVPWPSLPPPTPPFSCSSPEAEKTLSDTFYRQENEGSERPSGLRGELGREPGVTPRPDARPHPQRPPPPRHRPPIPRLRWDTCVSAAGVCAQLRCWEVTVGVGVAGTGVKLTPTQERRWP